MLETLYAQLRFAASVAFGVRFDLRSLERIIDTLIETRQEFGFIGQDASELIAGPELDEETRHEMQQRRFRSQAARAARETPYYQSLFEQLGLESKKLTYDALPITSKEALRATPEAFVCRNARPTLRMTTTGTTGRPTTIYFSDHEMRVYVALSAISLLFKGIIGSEDVVQVNSSSHAGVGNRTFAAACTRVGAMVSQAGLLEPEITLGLLTEERHLPGKKPRVSILHTYPSYVGRLVECGLRNGYRPENFGLERIIAGGELVTPGLRERARALFGEVIFEEGFGMTEAWPFGGTLCSQGHLHFDAAGGLMEVLALDGTGLAAPSTLGTLVLTPFPPYRETTLLLRYNTEDVVQTLPERPTCELRDLPATSHLLGKRRLSVEHDQGWTFPRTVLEALEAIEAVPLPARCGFWAIPGGVAVEVMVPQQNAATRARIEQALEERGIPLRQLSLVEDASQLQTSIPFRGDMREGTFSPPAPVSAMPAGSPP